MSQDTGKAKLPALPPVNATDPTLRNWMSAVAERLEVREGSRGNPAERVVTQREFAVIEKIVGELSTVKKAGPDDLSISLGNGITAVIPIAEFSAAIKRTRLWKDLESSLDDPRRFDFLSSELRALVEKSIALEAANRGADIKRTDIKIQDLDRSLAATVTELTAALRNNASGIRELQAVYVSSTNATAVQVTQLESSLGNYYQDGTPGRAQLEQTLSTQAEYITGLRAQYTVKLTAGGAVAGFGISATEYNGVPDSAFIIQANKFALVSPTYTGGMTSSPSSSLIPFGVDGSGVYINGTVRINTGGSTLTDLATNAAVPAVNYIGAFASAPATTTLKKNSVYKNTTDGNSYILSADGGTWGLFLEKGTTGDPGDAGVRGSVTLYASGSAWSDATANTAVTNATGSATKVVGDTVTISNGTNFAATRYWSGTAWVTPGVVIDGNLLVNGTISGSKIGANTVTASNINGTNLVVTNGTFSGSVTANTFTTIGGRFTADSSGNVIADLVDIRRRIVIETGTLDPTEIVLGGYDDGVNGYVSYPAGTVFVGEVKQLVATNTYDSTTQSTSANQPYYVASYFTGSAFRSYSGGSTTFELKLTGSVAPVRTYSNSGVGTNDFRLYVYFRYEIKLVSGSFTSFRLPTASWTLYKL